MAMPSTFSHGGRLDEDPRHQTSVPDAGCRSSRTPHITNATPESNTSQLPELAENGYDTMDTESASMSVTLSQSSDMEREELEPGHISVPILGYEVMEERARFSVFKIQVSRGPDDIWFIFRRYSDFDHLNSKLREIFPHFRLALPPKKWFGDNFDKNFLEDRMLGLQAFLNNLVGNRDVCNSQPVREFFCFDEPPGPHDSLEESRALCETLEERVFLLHQQVAERDRRIMLLEDQLRLSQLQVDNLRKALKIERNTAKHKSSLTSMKEVVETEEPQATSSNTETRPDTATVGGDLTNGSVCLTNSLKAAETIQMMSVSEQRQAEPANRHAASDSQAARQEPAAESSSGSIHQPAPDDAAPDRHRVVPGGSTDVAVVRKQDASHTTGPAQLCLPSNDVAASSGRASASSSPQPTLQTLAPTVGQDTMSPGAHSVDSSSKRRPVCAAAPKSNIRDTKDDNHNNNEAILI